MAGKSVESCLVKTAEILNMVIAGLSLELDEPSHGT